MDGQVVQNLRHNIDLMFKNVLSVTLIERFESEPNFASWILYHLAFHMHQAVAYMQLKTMEYYGTF